MCYWYIFISVPVVLVRSYKHVAVIVHNCTSTGVKKCNTINLQSREFGYVPGQHVCVSKCWGLMWRTWNCGGTSASLDYSAAASSCLLRCMTVGEWITDWAATRVQHNKGSIFNTRHQNSIKCNFIYSNIQFPENKKVYKATASLEWDSGLARVLYTLRPVGGIHKVPDLLQVLSMGLVALHNTEKGIMTVDIIRTLFLPHCLVRTLKEWCLHPNNAIFFVIFVAEAPNQPPHKYKTGPPSHLAVKFSGDQPPMIGHHRQ